MGDRAASRGTICLFGLVEVRVGPGGAVCAGCLENMAEGSGALQLRENLYCGVLCADRHQSELDAGA
ncbi:MAG: hypothetical protein ACREDR_12490 [Blastocatellia bacterium]